MIFKEFTQAVIFLSGFTLCAVFRIGVTVSAEMLTFSVSSLIMIADYGRSRREAEPLTRMDETGMRKALEEAEKALAEGEVPVGAALYHGDELLWADHNRREADKDPTAHAEMLCLRHGAEKLGDWRLKDCTLYVTLEPCPMCSGALLMSRLGRCVFGAADPDAGCCGSVYDLPADPALHGHTLWTHGVLEMECKALLDRFFSERRPEGVNQ